MINRKSIGDNGEDNAVNFLLANSYEVLERNFRFGRGEIDIIALKNSTMVFVEVKTRKNINYGYPETYLSEAQQERIHRVAEEYIQQNDWPGMVRFDVISVLWGEEEANFDHFEDAF